MRPGLGRHVYGLAAILFGVISLVWRDFGAPWQQIQVFGNVPHREVLVYLAAAVEIVGGWRFSGGGRHGWEPWRWVVFSCFLL